MTRPRPDLPAALRPLWWGAVVYRVVALAYAVVNLVRFLDGYARPGLAVVVVAVMAAWTAVSSVLYLRGRDRPTALVDLVVTAIATLSTLVVVGADRSASLPVITTVWSAGAVLSLAVAWGWRGGLAASVITVGVLVAVRRVLDGDLLYDVWLLIVVGVAVGLAADTMRRSTARLQRAIAAEAATAERERLARDIHDGVLQVLAFFRRRGDEVARADPDGPAAELARLAGEQEVALRRLVTSAAPSTDPDGHAPTIDLAAALGAVLPSCASLAVPADPVRVPAPTAEALVAVVREAAANTAEHAPAAGLWVLVEQVGDAVTISVRDDGPGIPDGRLAEARATGHLGVASSMRGRVDALGGTLSLHTAPGEGTEWEIAVGGGR